MSGIDRFSSIAIASASKNTQAASPEKTQDISLFNRAFRGIVNAFIRLNGESVPVADLGKPAAKESWHAWGVKGVVRFVVWFFNLKVDVNRAFAKGNEDFLNDKSVEDLTALKGNLSELETGRKTKNAFGRARAEIDLLINIKTGKAKAHKGFRAGDSDLVKQAKEWAAQAKQAAPAQLVLLPREKPISPEAWAAFKPELCKPASNVPFGTLSEQAKESLEGTVRQVKSERESRQDAADHVRRQQERQDGHDDYIRQLEEEEAPRKQDDNVVRREVRSVMIKRDSEAPRVRVNAPVQEAARMRRQRAIDIRQAEAARVAALKLEAEKQRKDSDSDISSGASSNHSSPRSSPSPVKQRRNEAIQERQIVALVRSVSKVTAPPVPEPGTSNSAEKQARMVRFVGLGRF